MKFFITLSLAIISMKAFSLPVISESNVVFRDSENTRKMYFFPEYGGLQLSTDGKPQFHVNYWGRGKKKSGLLSAILELKVNKKRISSLESFSPEAEISVMPVLSSYFRMIDSKLTPLFEVYELPSVGGLPGSPVPFSAILNANGNTKLEEVLRNSDEILNLFQGCYELSGVSPIAKGEYSFNPESIQNHFQNLSDDKGGLTQQEIFEEVKNLFLQSYITIVVQGGEAQEGDYLRIITNDLIDNLFFRVDESRRYRAAKSIVVNGDKKKIRLNGRYNVKKEVCVNMNLKGIEKFPELFSK